MQVKVTLSESVRERLVRRAASEHRSLAAMGGLLIERGLAVEGDPPVVVHASQEFVDGIRWMETEPGEAVESRDRPTSPPATVAGSDSRLREPGSASTPHFSTAEVEDELPWLPALGRRATQKDFEDPNFDPEEYR